MAKLKFSSVESKPGIHLCEDTNRVYGIFRTSPWATHVHAVDMLPLGTILANPALLILSLEIYKQCWRVKCWSAKQGQEKASKLKARRNK